MAVSATTHEYLLFGAGNFTVGGVDIGATTDPISFRVEQTIFFPNLNGARGPVTGTGFKVREVPSITATVVEIRGDIIQWAIPGASVGSSTSTSFSSSSICYGTVGCIPDTDYRDVVWTATDCDGDIMQIVVLDAIMTENMEWSFNNEGEAQLTMTFMGTYDPADADARPWCWTIEVMNV